MQTRRRILLIDNNFLYRTTVQQWLEDEGYEVYSASSINEAKSILETISVQLIVTDLRVTDDDDDRDMSGLYFARSVAPAIPKIILTGYPTVAIVREALRVDQSQAFPSIAVDFIDKTAGLRRIAEAVEQAFQRYVRSHHAQFQVGGALTDANAAVYITRQAEREVISGIQRMEYLLIIEPRQQGKTSLINYLIRHHELTETIFVYIDTATLERSTQRSWYESLCTRVVYQLNKSFPTAEWPNIPQNNVQWRVFLADVAVCFEHVRRYLVIVLDEIGTSIPDAAGCFSVLRDIFNSRQVEPHFRRLTFLLVGAFHPRDLVEDHTISPFNIARRVRLHDFTLEQVWRLMSNVASSDEQATVLAARVYHWTGGQPYLTHQLCSYLRPDATVADVESAVERLRREDENHLPPLLKRVNGDKSARTYVERILAGERIKFYPAESQLQAQLELLGLIKPDPDGYCVLRNRLYTQALTFSETFDRLPTTATVIRHTEDSTMTAKTTILFLAADPSDASRLRLGQELREIQEKLQMAKMREKFDLHQRMSVRPVDISQAILDTRPHIVHFAGHGTSTGALCFENEMGQAKPVQPDALGALFALVADQVKCVLMNACYSAVQADAIAQYIPWVVGMQKDIGDHASIAFALGFYQALGAGTSIEDAYQFGCVQIRLQGSPEHVTPVLLKRPLQD